MTFADEVLNSPEWAEHQFFNIDEMSRLLRMSKQAAYAAIRRGDVPAVKIGRTVRVSRKAMRELIGE
jgi:excisionase family DNA binding protein